MATVKKRGADPAKDVEKILRAIERNADGIRTVTFNTVKGQHSRRIFNDGGATEGGAIGQYKPSTKKRRNEAGRRIDKVDLEMTGTLRRSLTVGVGDGKVVLGLQEQKEPKITVEKGRIRITGTSDFSTVENAILQEKHFRTEIFAPSKEEIQRGEKTLIKEVDRVAKQALSQS